MVGLCIKYLIHLGGANALIALRCVSHAYAYLALANANVAFVSAYVAWEVSVVAVIAMKITEGVSSLPYITKSRN